MSINSPGSGVVWLFPAWVAFTSGFVTRSPPMLNALLPTRS
jgi:hypothetical protein